MCTMYLRSLEDCYSRLRKASDNIAHASSVMGNSWMSKAPSVMLAMSEVIVHAMEEREEVWQTLRSLPLDTTAPGGATPQTLSLEFYHRTIDRSVWKESDRLEAERVNAASFAG